MISVELMDMAYRKITVGDGCGGADRHTLSATDTVFCINGYFLVVVQLEENGRTDSETLEAMDAGLLINGNCWHIY